MRITVPADVYRGAAVFGIVVFVASVAYLPHLDVSNDRRGGALPPGLVGHTQAWVEQASGEREDYPYPVHVDENHLWAQMAQMQREDSLRFSEPYTGEPPGGLFGLKGSAHERGFLVAISQFQEFTGLPWAVVIRFVPALWLGLTAWGVWAMLRPWSGAYVAAALVALVPSTARLIGPSFLVPIGFGLAWIPVVALLGRETIDERRGALVFVLALAWAFFIHFIAGLAALLVVGAALPFARRPKRALALVGLSLLPVLWVVKTFFDEIQSEITKFNALPLQKSIFQHLGPIFLVAWALGILLLLAKPLRQQPGIVVAGALVSVLAFAMIEIDIVLHLKNYFLYERWHQPFAVLATIPVALAVVTAAEFVVRFFQRYRWGIRLGAPIAIVLTILALHPGVDGHMKERYYHVANDDDWASYAWASHELPPEYSTFLSDPWKAPIINALTGESPVTVLYPGSPPPNGWVYEAYLQGGSADGPFLVEHGATWVADARGVQAVEYRQLGPGIYGLRSPYLDAYNDALRAES